MVTNKMKTEMTRDDLVEVMESYVRMINRNGRDYPTVVLSDLNASLCAVLSNSGKPEYMDYKRVI